MNGMTDGLRDRGTYRHIDTEGQTYGQKGRHTDRQTERTVRQTGRQTDRNRHTLPKTQTTHQ